MQTSLYDITQAINDLQAREDLDPDIVKNTLDSLQETREQKLDNLANWIDDLQKDVDWDAKKIKEYQQDKKAKQAKIDSLTKYITQVLSDADIRSLHTDNHKLEFGRLSHRVVVDESKLPADYMVTKTTYSPDKTLIKQAIDAGKEVVGAHIEDSRKLKIL